MTNCSLSVTGIRKSVTNPACYRPTCRTLPQDARERETPLFEIRDLTKIFVDIVSRFLSLMYS